MAVQMRSMLEVADNSGARKLQMILPLGGASGKKAGLGDVVTAAVKEASPDGQVKKGKGGDRAHAQGIAPPRRYLHPL
jgi:large subunit ribosomal protein L14